MQAVGNGPKRILRETEGVFDGFSFSDKCSTIGFGRSFQEGEDKCRWIAQNGGNDEETDFNIFIVLYLNAWRDGRGNFCRAGLCRYASPTLALPSSDHKGKVRPFSAKCTPGSTIL